MKRVTILLEDELAAGLRACADKTGATTSGQIRAAIRMWLTAQQGFGAPVPPSEPVDEF